MLVFYLKTVVIYLIIYWALKRVARNIMLNRTDIDYKKYTGKSKGMYYIFCFIPVLRFLVALLVLFVTFAKKETLDKLFKKD